VTGIIKGYQRNGEFEFFVSQGADYEMYFVRTDERKRGMKQMRWEELLCNVGWGQEEDEARWCFIIIQLVI